MPTMPTTGDRVNCPTCGHAVQVIGRTTQHYEPTECDRPSRTTTNRVLWNERGKCIDEIVVQAEWVHVEQMHDRCWWIGIDLVGGGYWAGNFTCDSRGRMRFTEQEQDGFVWDEDDTHERQGEEGSGADGCA